MRKISFTLIIILLISLTPFNAAAATKQTAAESYYKKAVALSDAGKYQDAIKNFDLAIKRNAKYVLAYIGKGNALTNLKKYEEAISCFDKAMQIDWKDPQAYFYKGKVFYLQGNYEGAVTSFEVAIKLEFENADLYLQYGNALLALNKSEDAIAAYDKAIQTDNKFVQAYISKADLLYKKNNYSEAIKLYDIVIGLNPKNAYAYCSKGAALYFTAKYSDSVKAYDQALSINPNYEDAYVNKADSLIKLGKYGEALECLDIAKLLNPNDCHISISSGNAYYFQKLYEEALKHYDTALNMDPSALDAINGKGYSLYHLDKYAESIETLKKSLSVEPDDAFVNYHLSLAYAKNGDGSNCMIYLQKAISLNTTYMFLARIEEAFKTLSADEAFIQIVYDASIGIRYAFKNFKILNESMLSGTKFLDITTLGNETDDKKLLKACDDLLINLYSGNLYNQATADTCHVCKESPFKAEFISIGRSFKGQSLVGLKTTYESSEQSIVCIGKKSGNLYASMVKAKYKIKIDGQSSDCELWLIFVNNNNTWEYYGSLDPKD